ncbi:hypothetical protein EGP91_00300 [bacterium]|nr:hypothetical protein [bacterium]
MANASLFIKKMNDYKKCMKLLNCANYVFSDEIDCFEFKKISKYTKSKPTYEKVKVDFELVNELINRQDLLNAATVLRTLYENIIYIIATSYDKEIKITLNKSSRELRKVLVENCSSIFTDYFEPEDFNNIYKYLSKIIHPCSLKELVSYMNKTFKYKNYLLGNLKYMMLVIEYMYLNFLNKKIGNEESKFDLNLIDLCTYVNMMNITYYINDVKDSKSFIKRYFYYDTNNKYIIENQEKIKVVYETLIDKKDLVEEDIKELTKALDCQVNESKYKVIIADILGGK